MQAERAETGGTIAPGPRFVSRATFLWRIHRDPLRFYLEAWRRYGNFVRFERGGEPHYLLIHPDAVKAVLLENADNYNKDGIFEGRIRPMVEGSIMMTRGSEWNRRRKIMAPVWKAQNLGPHHNAIVEAIESAFRDWDRYADRGEPMDFVTALRDLNLDTSSRILMNVESGPSEPIGQAIRTATDAVVGRLDRIVPLPTWAPTATNRRFTTARRTLLECIDRQIASSRSDPNRVDLVSQLLALRDTDGSPAYDNRGARDEILAMILAWHKGPATALCWATYLLARHPPARKALQDEVDAVLDGRPPTFADVSRLPYCEMVVKETLRMYPALWGITRRAQETDAIAGYEIEAGAKVTLSPFITQRSPEFWDSPEEFRPERFAEETTGTPTRWNYFPYGRGNRQCLGEHFANLQMHLTLIRLTQRYEIELTTQEPIETTFVPTPRPAGPLPMRLKRR